MNVISNKSIYFNTGSPGECYSYKCKTILLCYTMAFYGIDRIFISRQRRHRTYFSVDYLGYRNYEN